MCVYVFHIYFLETHDKTQFIAAGLLFWSVTINYDETLYINCISSFFPRIFDVTIK